MSKRPVHPSDTADKFMLRLPPGWRDRLRESAELLGRSMNAEIVQRLRRSFEEDGDDRIKLSLPGDLWNSLMVDAGMNDTSMEERAVEILRAEYDHSSEYNRSVDKMLEFARENAELTDLVSQMKERENADFLLYYTKTVQLSQFVMSVLAGGDGIPEHIFAMAKELEALSNAETITLRRRYEALLFVQSLAEHSQRLDKEIEENSTETDED